MDPALEASGCRDPGLNLAQSARDTRRRFGRAAEADRDGEPRLPFRDRLLDLKAKGVSAYLVVAPFGSQREERDHLVGPALDQCARIADADDGRDTEQELALQRLDRVLRDLAHAVEATEVVDVDEHHDVAAVQP